MRLAIALMLMLAVLVPLIVQPGDAPAPSTGQTQPASTPVADPVITDDEVGDLLADVIAPYFSRPDIGDIPIDEVRPGMTDDEFADLLKRAADKALKRAKDTLKKMFSRTDAKTAGVPTPTR